MSCAVVLKDPRAELLAPAPFLSGRGLAREAAVLFLRSNPGYLGRRLALDAARELSSAAGAAGLETLLVPEAELPSLPPVEAEKVEPKPDGFYASAGAVRLFFPYDGIRLIAAAAWDGPAVPDAFGALKPGVFARLAELAGIKAPPVPQPWKDTFFRADVVGGEGPLRLVLRPERLDFSALGARRSPSSLDNFRALLDDAAAASFGAVRGGCLAPLLARAPLAPHKYASEAAADAALSRLLLLA